MKIVAMIQCRMGSTRLPGKVMKRILGRPVICLMLERVKRTKSLDEIVLLTTQNKADDIFFDIADVEKIHLYRGDECDVLDRYYQAALIHKPDTIIRLTGDCPLYEPAIVDQMVQSFRSSQPCDYLASGLKPLLPNGMDAEMFSFDALKMAWQNARLDYQREHVTPWIYENPGKFCVRAFEFPLSLSHLRLTLDTAEDFEVIRTIYEALYPNNPAFNLAEILEYLDQHPSIVKLNAHLSRNQNFVTQLSGYGKNFKNWQEYIESIYSKPM